MVRALYIYMARKSLLLGAVFALMDEFTCSSASLPRRTVAAYTTSNTATMLEGFTNCSSTEPQLLFYQYTGLHSLKSCLPCGRN